MLGTDRILFILIEEEQGVVRSYSPIGCLTSNGFDESTETLGTTTRENNGWRSSRGNLQSFSVSFEGIQIKTTGENCIDNKASYDRLKQFKRTREVLNFQIRNRTNDGNREFFDGIITDLGEVATVGEVITFSGSIEGYGEPRTVVVNCSDDNGGVDVPFTYDSIETFDSETTIFND